MASAVSTAGISLSWWRARPRVIARWEEYKRPQELQFTRRAYIALVNWSEAEIGEYCVKDRWQGDFGAVILSGRKFQYAGPVLVRTV